LLTLLFSHLSSPPPTFCSKGSYGGFIAICNALNNPSFSGIVAGQLPPELQGYTMACNDNGVASQQYLYVVGNQANCEMLASELMAGLRLTTSTTVAPPPSPSVFTPGVCSSDNDCAVDGICAINCCRADVTSCATGCTKNEYSIKRLEDPLGLDRCDMTRWPDGCRYYDFLTGPLGSCYDDFTFSTDELGFGGAVPHAQDAGEEKFPMELVKDSVTMLELSFIVDRFINQKYNLRIAMKPGHTDYSL
jgi:hypothetical protein